MQPAEEIPPPHTHQKEALKFLQTKIGKSYAGLFMEPGTGKTKTAILRSARLYARGEIDVVLVLAPNGVHNQWIEEQFPEHCPIPWRAIVWKSSRPKRWKDEARSTLKKTDCLVVVSLNWEALTTKNGVAFCKWLLENRRVHIVADESSRIRNPRAIRTRMALKLAEDAPHRMILTGTPLVKGFENLWSQMQFLSPEILNCRSFVQFRSLYCKTRPVPGHRGAVMISGYQRTDELLSLMRPHVFIKNKKDCLDIPDKIPTKSPVPMTAEQAVAYQTMRDTLIVELSELKRVTVAHLISARAKLRQIAIGFIIDENKRGNPIADNRFTRCLEHIEEAPGKIILWASFKYCLRRWEEILTKRGFGYVRYAKGNNAAIRTWKREDDCQIFLANPHSGGIGLNLADADTMIFFNNVDDLEVRLQAEDRAHRMGQTKHLHIIDLFAPDTVDVKIQKQQADKASLLDMVMNRSWRDLL